MHTVDASCEFDTPAEMLWDLLADFGHIERWWPQGDNPVVIERVVLEGEGPGMVRHIYNVGMPNAISERLDALDREHLIWKLSIVGERPAGVTYYQATGQLTPLPGNRSRIDYHGEFTTQSGEADEARAFFQGAYALMFSGLAQATARA